MKEETESSEIHIPVDGITLNGDLEIPDQARGLVIFAHGSGSSRFSPRNRFVAQVLNRAGLATLLFDLLTPAEEEAERLTRHLRFDIDLLSRRLAGVTDWVSKSRQVGHLPLGYFGASTGAAAALVAAVLRPQAVRAVVSRGGRPDLAESVLERVRAATLLIVGGNDPLVLELNRRALARLTRAVAELAVVPGAGHLFEEPGTLEQVAELARDWFLRWLGKGTG